MRHITDVIDALKVMAQGIKDIEERERIATDLDLLYQEYQCCAPECSRRAWEELSAWIRTSIYENDKVPEDISYEAVNLIQGRK